MTIKQILLSLTFALVALIVLLSGQTLLKSWDNYQKDVFAEQTNPIVEQLLTAAGHWAVERGATNSALAYPKKVPDNMKVIIMERREKADAAYSAALGMLVSVEFEGREQLLSDTQARYEEVLAMREGVDKNIQKSKIARSNKVMKAWVPTMSTLILTSQELRYAVGGIVSEIDPQLATQIQMQHFSWVMSEYAGRERAIIGGMLSANTALNLSLIHI